MDLSIHHSRTLLFTSPSSEEKVKLKEVKLLHGRLLHIIIGVLNIAYEKEVGARLLYRNLSGKGIMANLKASYIRTEKNSDANQPDIDVFEVKYDIAKNRSNRAPWSPVINLVPYYRVKGEYYEDNPNDRHETYRVAEDSLVRIICKKGYVFKAPIVSKFESDLAWELLEKEAGLDKTNEAKMNLMKHNQDNQSEHGDFIAKNNKVFWEVNFKDAIFQVGGSKKVWNNFCHKTSCIPDPSLDAYNGHFNSNELDDYDYCEDVKGWKNRPAQDTTDKNYCSWKIPGCEEFYKQDMFQNPFAYVSDPEEDEEEVQVEITKPAKKETTKTKSASPSSNNNKSSKKAGKNRNKENQKTSNTNPKTMSNKASNKTIKV